MASQSKKTAHRKKVSWYRLDSKIVRGAKRIRKNIKTLQARRPHRSFRLTKRRDYIRSMALPGFFSMLNATTGYLIQRWRTFLPLILLYSFIILAFRGIGPVVGLIESSDFTRDVASEYVDGVLLEAAVAAVTSINGFTLGGDVGVADGQTIVLGFLGVMLWLTTIWLLRQQLAGNEPSLRDGIYNAGAPIISTLIIAFVITLQIAPLSLALYLNTFLSQSAILTGGLGSMLMFGIVALVAALVLYWVVASIIALVVVTLPGMYPGVALKTAGDIVASRRLRILLRITWAVVVCVLVWLIVTIPFIMFDSWLGTIVSWYGSIPVVPIFLVLLSTGFLVWFATYIYLLYRKIVEDEAPPA